MIIPMVKYTFLVYHHEYVNFLANLRDMGMVHIVEKKGAVSDDIRDQMQYIAKVEKALRKLRKLNPDAEIPKSTKNIELGKALYEEFDEIESSLEHQRQQLVALQKEFNEVEPWGYFTSENIKQLANNGIAVHFYTAANRQYNPEWETQYALSEINNIGGYVYFVIFANSDEEINIQAEEVRMHDKSLQLLEQQKKSIEENITTSLERIDEMSKQHFGEIENYYHSLLESLAYDKTLLNTSSEANDKLKILEGWLPTEKEGILEEQLNSQGIVYLAQKPTKEDSVPVLLKNNKFASKFEVIGELYALPKYGELDLTPFYAPFYMLFFGFCLGDAGYGILISIVALFAHRKVSKELKPILMLVFYLGLATILFGIIGGTFFGINLYDIGFSFYSDLQLMLKANNTNINNVLFYSSIALGGIQIMFGMVLKAINECKVFGWKLALGTIGWIFLIIGLITIYGLKTQAVLPEATLNILQYVVLGIGGFMILVLNNLTRNPLINIGAGLWDTYNMVTGMLGDLLSYIRLFAVGISSAILGFVFNSLALSVSGSIIGVFFMIIILIVGHSINIFMSSLGAFVHPMRLIFVEFYKNAGFSGGGKKYNPFRKIVQ